MNVLVSPFLSPGLWAKEVPLACFLSAGLWAGERALRRPRQVRRRRVRHIYTRAIKASIAKRKDKNAPPRGTSPGIVKGSNSSPLSLSLSRGLGLVAPFWGLAAVFLRVDTWFNPPRNTPAKTLTHVSPLSLSLYQVGRTGVGPSPALRARACTRSPQVSLPSPYYVKRGSAVLRKESKITPLPCQVSNTLSLCLSLCFSL